MLRFEAPASSELTLNDLRLALLNALVARQQGGEFLLRIADRNPEASAFDPQPLLDKCLLHDRLQHQSENLRRYRQLSTTLLKSGHAYVCTCDPAAPCEGACPNRTAEEVETLHHEKRLYTIRITAPKAPVTFDDTVQGEIAIPSESIGSFVLLDSMSIPTACFAAAVDDMLSGISMVIRDTTHSLQTAREIHIRTLLGFTEAIAYAHIAPLTGEIPTVRALFEEGVLPDAMIAYLLSIGQMPPETMFTFSDAAAWFDLTLLKEANTPYDPQALRACNRRHLQQMDDKALSGLYRFADADIGRLIKLYLDEASTLNELDQRILPIFAPKPCDGEDAEMLRTLSEHILSAPYFKTYEAFYTHLQTQSGLEDAVLYPLLERLLTGAAHAPALDDVYTYLKSYITEVTRCQP